MKRLSWKYIAGLMDGEGCIDLRWNANEYGHSVTPRVRIALVDHSQFLLDMLHNSHGGNMEYRKGSGNHRNSVSWGLHGYKRATPFLRNIVNHLYIKREQARFILWLERNIKGKRISRAARETIRAEMKKMKVDPHRLSEKAQEKILEMLQSD